MITRATEHACRFGSSLASSPLATSFMHSSHDEVSPDWPINPQTTPESPMEFALNASTATTESTSNNDETATRILDTAMTLFLEFGYRRTTMETVAKRMGVSRVTLYRHYADKAALFQAVILREIQRSAGVILESLAQLTVEQNPVIEGFVLAVSMSRQHPLVRRLLDTDPEWLLLHTTLKGEQLVAWGGMSAAMFLQQAKFKDWLKQDDFDVAGELLVRILFSAVISPGGLLGGDGAGLRRAARYLLQPMLRQT